MLLNGAIKLIFFEFKLYVISNGLKQEKHFTL